MVGDVGDVSVSQALGSTPLSLTVPMTVDASDAVATVAGARGQPILATDGDATQRAFDRVVGDQGDRRRHSRFAPYRYPYGYPVGATAIGTGRHSG